MTTTPAAATVDLYTRPHAELANILTEGIPKGGTRGFRFGPDAAGKYWTVESHAITSTIGSPATTYELKVTEYSGLLSVSMWSNPVFERVA